MGLLSPPHPEEQDEDGNPRRRCLHIIVCAGVAGERRARSCTNVASGIASRRDDLRAQLWVCDQHKHRYRLFIPKKQFWDNLYHTITVERLENG